MWNKRGMECGLFNRLVIMIFTKLYFISIFIWIVLFIFYILLNKTDVKYDNFKMLMKKSILCKSWLFISGLLSMTKMIIQLPTYVNNLSLLGHDLIIPISAYVGMILSLFLLVKLEKKKLQTYFKGILAYPFLGIIWATEQMFALFCKDAVWHPIKHTQGVDIKFLK